MAKDNFKRYVWLIDLIQEREEISFKEIDQAWRENEALNPHGEKLALRTFNNHIKAIREIFDIEIYYRDRTWQINPQSWIDRSLLERSLLAKLSLNNAILEYDPLKDSIIYEDDVYPDNEVLRIITRAMNRSIKVYLTYQPFGRAERTYEIEPYCLKMFNHRWYILGNDPSEKKLKVFALDERLKNVTAQKFPTFKDYFNKPKHFDGKEYFDSAVGVIVNPGDVEPIRIKVFGVQADYWRSAPVHHSQREVETKANYSIFELWLNPDSLELEQLLFSKIDQIEVLEPEILRNKMISNLEKMKRRYS